MCVCVSTRCLEKFSSRPIATSIRKWIGGERLYWLGCSQWGQVQGSFVWNISNHFERVMRISLAWNFLSLSLSPLSFPVTIYPLAYIFHKGGTNQPLPFSLFLSSSLSPEPCLQQPFVCTEGMETGIQLIPLEEVASLRVSRLFVSCVGRRRKRCRTEVHQRRSRNDCQKLADVLDVRLTMLV